MILYDTTHICFISEMPLIKIKLYIFFISEMPLIKIKLYIFFIYKKIYGLTTINNNFKILFSFISIIPNCSFGINAIVAINNNIL